MSKPLTTRATAIQARHPTYYTGKPCKHGHLSDRSTVDGACLECRVAYHRNYQREQRKLIRESLRHSNEA